MDKVEMLASYFNITTADLMTDPTSKNNSSSDPAVIAKLLESNPSLYELLRLSIQLQDQDIALIKGIIQRILQLQGEEA